PGDCTVFQFKAPYRPEAEGRHLGGLPQFGLVVGVPVDAVGTVPVQIEQGAVEDESGGGLDPLPDPGQERRPGGGDEAHPGVAVVGAGIAVPGVQPGDGDTPPGDGNFAALPGGFSPQPGEQGG